MTSEMVCIAVAGAIAALGAACSNAADPKCVPGESAACACTDGREGAQLCLAGGTFDVCVCTSVDGGAPPIPDAGYLDATSQDAEPADADPPDAGSADATLPGYCVDPPEGYMRIAAGMGIMGTAEDLSANENERPQHPIRITRDFWMHATETTQAEWSSVMTMNRSRHAGCERCPVESVTWQESVDYANALSAQCGLPKCYGDTPISRVGVFADPSCLGFRLPTEAEWEYAARAGTMTSFYSGFPLHPEITRPDCEPRIDNIAWYLCDTGTTQVVGLLAPNTWGLYDMAGNVWEYTADGLRDYPVDGALEVDPVGTTLARVDGPRVIRGGGYISQGWECRSASRLEATDRASYAGFRLVRTVPPGR